MACTCRYTDRTTAQLDRDVERLRIELRAVFTDVYRCINRECERNDALEARLDALELRVAALEGP